MFGNKPAAGGANAPPALGGLGNGGGVQAGFASKPLQNTGNLFGGSFEKKDAAPAGGAGSAFTAPNQGLFGAPKPSAGGGNPFAQPPKQGEGGPSGGVFPLGGGGSTNAPAANNLFGGGKTSSQ